MRSWSQFRFSKLKQLSSISTTSPSFTPPEKLQERTQNKIRHCLAAQMQPISNGLVVKMEFCTTLEGRRMAALCELERGQ